MAWVGILGCQRVSSPFTRDASPHRISLRSWYSLFFAAFHCTHYSTHCPRNIFSVEGEIRTFDVLLWVVRLTALDIAIRAGPPRFLRGRQCISRVEGICASLTFNFVLLMVDVSHIKYKVVLPWAYMLFILEHWLFLWIFVTSLHSKYIGFLDPSALDVIDLHIIPHKLGFWRWHDHYFRQLVVWVQRVGVASGAKLIDPGSCPSNVIDQELTIGLVDVMRDYDSRTTFLDIVVAVIENLALRSGFLNESRTSPFDVGDIQ